MDKHPAEINSPIETSSRERRTVEYTWTKKQASTAYKTGQFLELSLIDTPGNKHLKKMRITCIQQKEGKTVFDGLTEHGNRVVLYAHGGGVGELEFFSSDIKNRTEIGTSGLAEEYEKKLGSFRTFLEAHNEKIFDRFVSEVVKIIEQHPQLSQNEFLDALFPSHIPLDPPISIDEQKKIFTAIKNLLTPLADNGSGLGVPDKERDPEKTTNFFFRGTGEYASNKAVGKKRKLYINPEFHNIPRFIDEFYRILDKKNIPIGQSKLYTDDMRQNEKGEYIEQGHNTFVIYCAGDEHVYQVIEAIQQAEQLSGVPIHDFKSDPVIRSPRMLENKVIIGGPDNHYSFDNWSKAVANRAFTLHKQQGGITVEDAKRVMSEELHSRTSKKPNEYLNIS